MKNFSYSSYTDSGDFSPRSHEIEFDNPPPWQAKFMCSYGGKILPRPHDNQLCYVGGETKILAVDRSIKLSAFIAKLSALCGGGGGGGDVSFKYQLPGEDFDALISVSNEEDLDHMMLEYDRLYRTSVRQARMRLFIFQSPVNLRGSVGSEGSRPDPELFVEALNSAPIMVPDHVIKPPAVSNKAEFLFRLEKVVAPPPPPPPLPPLPANTPIVTRAVNPIETVVGGYTGDYYAPKVALEKIPASLATVPPPVSAPAGYWPEKQVSSGGFSTPVTSLSGTPEQPVYVIPASGGGAAVFHPPMVRPVTGPTAPVYGHVPQRVAPNVYRELPVYNAAPPPPPPLPPSAMPLSGALPPMSTMPLPSIPPPSAALPNTIVPPPSAALPNTIIPPFSSALPNVPPQVPKIVAATYPESVGIMRQSAGVGAASEAVSYGPVAYDSAMRRQVYYTAPGGVVVAPTVTPPARVLPQTISPLTAAMTIGSDGRAGGGVGSGG